MKTSLTIILSTTIFIVLCSVVCEALPFIRSAQLSNAVTQAESFAAKGNFVDAALCLENALVLETPDALKDLAEIKLDNCGPYRLHLVMMRFQYLFRAGKTRNEALYAEIKDTIDNYKEMDVAATWYTIKDLYWRIADYGRATKNMPLVREAHEAVMSADPSDTPHTAALLELLLSEDPAAMDTVLQTYRAAGGADVWSIDFIMCRKVQAADGDVVSTGIALLKKHSDIPIEPMKELFALMRSQLSADDVTMLRQYYSALNTLAIRQESDESSVAKIAYILNEKKKLETIMPELKN